MKESYHILRIVLPVLLVYSFLASCSEEDLLFEDNRIITTGSLGSAEITISATVTLSESYHLEEALKTELGDETWKSVQSLTIKGLFYGKDSETVHQLSSLVKLDMKDAQFKWANDDALDHFEYQFIQESGSEYNVIETVRSDDVVQQTAFAGKPSLKEIILPESVTEIQGFVFYESGLNTISIPDSVKSIGGHAFYGCRQLTQITLPDSLEEIGGYAFMNCEALESIHLPNSLKYMGERVFCQCTALKEINYPISLAYVGSVAFEETSITSLIVPEGATVYAGLSGCESLESLTLPTTLKEIGEGACYYNTSLTNVYIPEGVEKIGKEAFRGCYKLIYINIPSTVISVGNAVFDNCWDLSSILWDSPVNIEEPYRLSVNSNAMLFIRSHNGITPIWGPSWRNVIVDGVAEKIDLSKSQGGFYTPVSFTANKIVYSIDTSWYGTSLGKSCRWDAITLPFTPTSIVSVEKGELAPFGSDKSDKEEAKPFWLRSLTKEGWIDEISMKPYKPYIVSFPNNSSLYPDEYNINGEVLFIGENVEIPATPVPLVEDEGSDYYYIPVLYGLPYGEERYLLQHDFPSGVSSFVKSRSNVPPFSAYARPKEGAEAAAVLPITPSTVKTGTATRSVTGKRKPLKDDM